MNDGQIEVVLLRYREDLARAAVDSELARAMPREPWRQWVARRLMRLAERVEGEGPRPRGRGAFAVYDPAGHRPTAGARMPDA